MISPHQTKPISSSFGLNNPHGAPIGPRVHLPTCLVKAEKRKKEKKNKTKLMQNIKIAETLCSCMVLLYPLSLPKLNSLFINHETKRKKDF